MQQDAYAPTPPAREGRTRRRRHADRAHPIETSRFIVHSAAARGAAVGSRVAGRRGTGQGSAGRRARRPASRPAGSPPV